jgi:hypothetical protein
MCSTYQILIHVRVYIHVCIYIISLFWTLYVTYVLHSTVLHFNKPSRLPSDAVCDILTSVTIKLPNSLLDVKFVSHFSLQFFAGKIFFLRSVLLVFIDFAAARRD